jgi:hypothetical protein
MERELAEAYKRGLLPENLKAAYEEAVRRGLVSPSDGYFAINDKTGDVVYRGAGADNWEPAVVAVVKKTRAVFALGGEKWKQVTDQRQGIKVLTEDALSDNNEWVLVNFPDKIGDVMFSPNFQTRSRDERNTAARAFFEMLNPPIKTQVRSELANPSFWILLFSPPITVGIALLLMGWIVVGFRRSQA